MLMGHGTDVPPDVGTIVAGRQRSEPATALSHVSFGIAGGTRKNAEGGTTCRHVHARYRVPAESFQYSCSHHRRRCARTLSAAADFIRRKRHRLDTLRAGSYGFRVGRPLPRPESIDEAQ